MGNTRKPWHRSEHGIADQWYISVSMMSDDDLRSKCDVLFRFSLVQASGLIPSPSREWNWLGQYLYSPMRSCSLIGWIKPPVGGAYRSALQSCSFPPQTARHTRYLTFKAASFTPSSPSLSPRQTEKDLQHPWRVTHTVTTWLWQVNAASAHSQTPPPSTVHTHTAYECFTTSAHVCTWTSWRL